MTRAEGNAARVVLSALDAWERQAPCVCKAWHQAWLETKEQHYNRMAGLVTLYGALLQVTGVLVRA